jgi:hypothetical protein
MRKRFIVPDHRIERDEQWLDLTQLAALEVTSESDSHPIESAILHDAKGGWCAAAPGKQTIRIVFDEPQSLARVLLVFEEHVVARSQEFVLRWRADGHRDYRDIVRQQWNFSPPDTIREVEDYRVQLSKAKALELVIWPDIGGKVALASLLEMRLAS